MPQATAFVDPGIIRQEHRRKPYADGVSPSRIRREVYNFGSMPLAQSGIVEETYSMCLAERVRGTSPQDNGTDAQCSTLNICTRQDEDLQQSPHEETILEALHVECIPLAPVAQLVVHLEPEIRTRVIEQVAT